jgi:alkylation response protein AidB-like acyl-CoA dehydrogenase
MTVSLDSRAKAADVVAAVRALTPEIAARAAEIESARRVPADLLDRLRAAGAFALSLPAGHGGPGADLGRAMQVYEELSGADASVAWIVFIGGGVWLDLAHLPRATFDEIYGTSGTTIVAGVFNPTGTLEPVAGGYRVNGRWSFASGCEHADWIYGNCMDMSSGEPQLRSVVFRPDQVEIEDTWSVVGLCGTGSHHFRVEDVTVAAEWTANPFGDAPCVDSPLTAVPVPAVLALVMAVVPLGIARAALDDVTELATGKVPLLSSSSLGANPLFQYQLADADAKLRAARASLYELADEVWAAATRGDELTPVQRAHVRATGVHVATTAAAVVETAYRAGGGSSLYLESPLQRRLRDVQAVCQHFLLKPDTLTTCGAVLAGQNPELTIF